MKPTPALMVCALTMASMLTPLIADAGQPKCKWKGDKDPFTGEDARHIDESYYFGALSFSFLPAREDKTVPIELRIKYGGATHDDWTLPLKLLLVDGTVLELTPVRPTPGSVRASSNSVITYFELPISLPAAEAQKIYKGGGVKQVRFDFPDGNHWDFKFKKKDYSDLATLAWCSLNGAGAK